MSTRKIKDAIDLTTNEPVYLKGHALATYMSDGRTVEEAITASSGGGITSIKIDNVSKIPINGVVDLGYINKEIITTTSSTMTLTSNVYYINTNTSLTTLTITLSGVSNENIINEYFFEFTTSSSGTALSFPSSIKWVDGITPIWEAGCTYQVSIVNNLCSYIKFI